MLKRGACNPPCPPLERDSFVCLHQNQIQTITREDLLLLLTHRGEEMLTRPGRAWNMGRWESCHRALVNGRALVPLPGDKAGLMCKELLDLVDKALAAIGHDFQGSVQLWLERISLHYLQMDSTTFSATLSHDGCNNTPLTLPMPAQLSSHMKMLMCQPVALSQHQG